MKCEAHIRLTRWHIWNNRDCCSFRATHLVYGVPMCSKHASDRAGAVPIDPGALIQSLREIAHGRSDNGPVTDAAVMQTIARRALGELRAPSTEKGRG